MRFVKFVLIFLLIIILSVTSAVAYVHFRIPRLENNLNILVLGKGGEGHTAPNLTDTIMLVGLNNYANKQSLPLRGKTSIVSLPRDIWITEIKAKLNTAYHYGGFKMAGESVTSITGQPINYTVVIDFSLFKDLLDSIGGIEVEVENSFIDEKYPIAGKENDLCNGDRLFKCRYETLQFTKGVQYMDGELALKFVRSRNAVGDEGTDIAREKRQQKVISAIKNKLISKEVLLDVNKIKNLYNVFVSHIESDIDQKTMLSIARFAVESKFNINFLTIPEDILVVSQNNKKYDKQYVFVPKSGTWIELQEWIAQKI